MFPDVKAVVHAHTTEVLPFANTGTRLYAQTHTVRFYDIVEDCLTDAYARLGS
jgi:ribulose-5-phosphate 4-epimerase/fuculose-1-phosphate aldolase